jgi:Family of unknown function (DUF6174)/S-layer homology domain
MCLISWVYATTIVTDSTSNEDVVNRWYQNNITKFYTEKDFNWSASITRAQATKMFMSWLDMHKDLTERLPQSLCTIFIDDTQIDSSLKTQVYNACGYGILKWNNGKFMPNDFIPAEHAMIALWRLKKIFPSLNDYFNAVALKKGYVVKRIDFLRALYELEKWIKWQSLAKEQQQLDAAKILWSKNILKNYMITQTVSCFCMWDYTRPITYQINSSVVVSGSAMYSDMSGGKAPSDMYNNLNTVESAFIIIQEAINNKAESVQVKYDSILWYPTSISIDMSKMIADEERYITFSIKK